MRPDSERVCADAPKTPPQGDEEGDPGPLPKRLRGILADRPRAVAAVTRIFLEGIEKLRCDDRLRCEERRRIEG